MGRANPALKTRPKVLTSVRRGRRLPPLNEEEETMLHRVRSSRGVLGYALTEDEARDFAWRLVRDYPDQGEVWAEKRGLVHEALPGGWVRLPENTDGCTDQEADESFRRMVDGEPMDPEEGEVDAL